MKKILGLILCGILLGCNGSKDHSGPNASRLIHAYTYDKTTGKGVSTESVVVIDVVTKVRAQWTTNPLGDTDFRPWETVPKTFEVFASCPQGPTSYCSGYMYFHDNVDAVQESPDVFVIRIPLTFSATP